MLNVRVGRRSSGVIGGVCLSMFFHGSIQAQPVGVAKERDIVSAQPRCEARAVPLPGSEPTGGPRGGPLDISPNYDATVTAARQTVLDYAISEWEAIIQERGYTPSPYTVNFTFAAFVPGDNTLAVTSTHYWPESGNLDHADMSFNTRFAWYVDATPGDDGEFTGGSPPADYDLLTVARHELGHAVGHLSLPRVDALLSGNNFDPPRLNTAWTPNGGGHTDPAWLPDDFLTPSIGTSTRRPISLYPAVSVVARAYHYAVPMRYVDPLYSGTVTGTAFQPYITLSSAVSAPTDIPLLLSNDTHHVPIDWNSGAGNPHRIQSARGGATVAAP